MEEIFPVAGKEKKEERLAWTFLEVVYLCPANTRVRVEEEDAGKGGRDQGWRQRGLANQNH